MPNENEKDFDILTLLDEDGVEHEFELVDTLDIEGQEYAALIPVINDPEDFLSDSGELVIMKITQEDGEEFLDAVEDEDEYNRVSEVVIERLSEYFDFEQEDGPLS